jgi:hypothetical protein
LLPDCRTSVASRKFLPEARDTELHRNRQKSKREFSARKASAWSMPFVKLVNLAPGGRSFMQV